MSKKTVLIITNKFDVHADHLVPMIQERGATAFRLNTEDLLASYSVSWNPFGTGSVSRHHHHADLEDVDAVWYRKPNDYELPTDWACFDEFLREELRATMGGIYRCMAHACWINPLDAQRRASYKLLQLRTACQVGLSVPDSLVTNDPDEAMEFANRHAQSGIAIKSLGSGLVHLPPGKTIFTNRLDASGLPDKDRLASYPHFLQAYVDKGVELRVTVVGGQVFVCEMDTQASPNEGARVDWRRYDLENVDYRQGTIPEQTELAIMRLMERLGLVYGAIDLIRTPEGEHVFLEVNPSGQWLWIEQRTALPISSAVADALVIGLSLSSEGNSRRDIAQSTHTAPSIE